MSINFSSKTKSNNPWGEAFTEVKEKSGHSTYNVRIKYIWNEDMGEAWKELVWNQNRLLDSVMYQTDIASERYHVSVCT